MFAGVGCFQEVEKDNEQRASFRPSQDWRSRLGEQGCDEHYDDQHDDDGNRIDNDAGDDDDDKLSKQMKDTNDWRP